GGPPRATARACCRSASPWPAAGPAHQGPRRRPLRRPARRVPAWCPPAARPARRQPRSASPPPARSCLHPYASPLERERPLLLGQIVTVPVHRLLVHEPEPGPLVDPPRVGEHVVGEQDDPPVPG